MKEFDLRPFEVKKKKDKVYEIENYASDGTKIYTQFGNLDIISEAVSRKISKLDDFEKLILQIREYVEKDWQWEDIKVGWFFKTKCPNRSHVFIKISQKSCFCLYDPECTPRLCIDDTQPIDFSEFEDIWSPEKISITNAYDCPELAKALMIERIVT